MSVEDTILKILEARARGLDNRSTANEVGLSIFITTRYEKITKRAIKDAISFLRKMKKRAKEWEVAVFLLCFELIFAGVALAVYLK